MRLTLGSAFLCVLHEHLLISLLFLVGPCLCQEIVQNRILYQWKNVSSSLASPRGRTQSELLVDSNRGYIYLLGGYNYAAVLSKELWRYNFKMSLWASIVPPTPTPSLRMHASAVDLKRDVFYVFGGISVSLTTNSFWMFNLTTRRWLLKRTGEESRLDYDPGFYPPRGNKDKQSYPSARTEHAMTVDEETGNVYVCCGTYTQEAGYLSDFWEWEYESDIWILWSGSDPYQATFEVGRYGIRGEAAETNMPGGRWKTSMAFHTEKRSLYLFGGHGMAATDSGPLNDFWEWNANLKMWKWIGGANFSASLGQTGPVGVPSVDHFPAARAGHTILIHNELNAMYVYDGTQEGDLWRYNFMTLEWTCLGKWTGSQPELSSDHQVLPMPISRDDPALALDRSTGIVYLFGGERYSNGYVGTVQDFWAFNPTKCTPGYQLTIDLVDCEECPTGYYQPTTSIYACRKCPLDSNCNSTHFTCNTGYIDAGNQTCLSIKTHPHLTPLKPSAPVHDENWWKSNPTLAIFLLTMSWIGLFVTAFLAGFLKLTFLTKAVTLDSSFDSKASSSFTDSSSYSVSSSTFNSLLMNKNHLIISAASNTLTWATNDAEKSAAISQASESRQTTTLTTPSVAS